MFRYLPEQASDFAYVVDDANYLVTDISVFFTVIIVGAMIYFAVRYRKRDGVDHETPQIEGSKALELVWTIVPSIICIFVAAYGYIGFTKMRTAPREAIEIQVFGQQWQWSFEYPNGKKTTNEFTVPVGKAVKLIMTSKDVLHSFFVPGMRTKMDVIPGRYTMEWFRPIKTGPQQVFCTEYCGTSHSGMLATLNVVSESEYERWVEDKGRVLSPVEEGAKLYNEKACVGCHSLDGTPRVGPSFLNLYGRKEMMEGGEGMMVDENYLKESIINSQARIVMGYGTATKMPAFEGQLTDDEVGKLIMFIKAQKGEAAKPKTTSAADLAKLTPDQRGKKLYVEKVCSGCHSIDGSKVVGPSFKGVYGREAEWDDGMKYKADDAYIKDSILNPQAHIVKGYPHPSPMPGYQGQLDDSQIGDIIEFMKTLK